MYLLTLLSPTLKPSLRSSPWMRGAPSPIGIGRFFTSRGAAVIRSEFLWIWLPAGVLVVSALILRSRRAAGDARP